MFCKKCGTKLLENSESCPKCGFNRNGTYKCDNCGNLIDERDRYCEYCGTKKGVKDHSPKEGFRKVEKYLSPSLLFFSIIFLFITSILAGLGSSVMGVEVSSTNIFTIFTSDHKSFLEIIKNFDGIRLTFAHVLYITLAVLTVANFIVCFTCFIVSIPRFVSVFTSGKKDLYSPFKASVTSTFLFAITLAFMFAFEKANGNTKILYGPNSFMIAGLSIAFTVLTAVFVLKQVLSFDLNKHVYTLVTRFCSIILLAIVIVLARSTIVSIDNMKMDIANFSNDKYTAAEFIIRMCISSNGNPYFVNTLLFYVFGALTSVITAILLERNLFKIFERKSLNLTTLILSGVTLLLGILYLVFVILVARHRLFVSMIGFADGTVSIAGMIVAFVFICLIPIGYGVTFFLQKRLQKNKD